MKDKKYTRMKLLLPALPKINPSYTKIHFNLLTKGGQFICFSVVCFLNNSLS